MVSIYKAVSVKCSVYVLVGHTRGNARRPSTVTCARVHHDIEPFYHKRFELSVKSPITYRGVYECMAYPQNTGNDELDVARHGIVRMKQLARSYICWPNVDSDVKQCTSCIQTKSIPTIAPLIPGLSTTQDPRRHQQSHHSHQGSP